MATLEEEWLVTLQQEQSSVLGALKQSQASARGIVGALRFALSYMRPYWGQEVLILLGVLLSSLFTVILPLAFGRAIGDIISEDYSELTLILIVVAGLFIIQSPAAVVKEYLTARLGAKVTNDIRLEMFEHLQRLSANFYSRNQPGDIASRFYGDLLLIYQALTATLPLLLGFAVTFTFGLITVFVLQWKLALLVVLSLPFVFIIPRWLGSRASRLTVKQQTDFGRVANTLQESVGAQQLVKAYNLQGLMLSRFRGQLDQLGKSMTQGAFSAVLPGISATLIIDAIDVVALIVGTYLVFQGTFSVGDLATFQLLIGAVIAPTTSLTGVTQILVLASAGMHRVEQLLNEQPQIVDAPDARPLGRFSREIRFEKVNFSYTGEQVNLRDLNLTILAGQSIAFVGPSGSGKSTILNLLMRFYDPTTGAVTIDGQDLRQVTQQSLRSQVGVLFQETFLYNTTIRENITQGKPDATDREVEAAAKAAEIHDFILSLPRGYDTPVGERGGQLSGGQRQRIALARAILYDPQVLLLDEPTSALDPQTEAAINATLRKLGQGRTVITVTHRLKSVENADRIVVLERGRVVEQGTHQELLDAGGLYQRLWGQQNGFVPAASGRRRGVEASRLRTIPLFGNLDGDLLLALADSFVVERHDEGQILFEEGDPGDKLYFIDHGEVEVVATGPTGEERRAAMLRDGDYFGEMALLRDGPRTATVRTRAPSVLLSLDREQFLDLLQALPNLGTAFERGLEARQVNPATLR